MKIPNFQCEVSIMGIILTDKRKGEIAEQLKTDKRFAQLWNDYVARVKSYTSNEKNENAPKYDRTKWWHYIWERVGDAAMVYAKKKYSSMGIPWAVGCNWRTRIIMS